MWQHYLANAKLSGDRYSEAVAVTNLGAIYDALEQYNEALESYHQGLVIFREMGDRSKEIWVLNNIGTTYNTLAQYDKAVEAYQSAVAIEMPLGASLLLMLPLQSVCKHSLLSGTLMLIPLTGQLNLLPKSWLNVNPNPLLPRQLDFRTLSTVTCT